MPKDSAPTRSAILAAALQALKRGGFDEFSIEVVARRAGVAKGLVLYHFESRRQLLRLCAGEVAAERERRLAGALAAGTGGGTAGIDAAWAELVREEEDGTARAWLALCAAGLVTSRPGSRGLEERARQAIFDGCTAALAAGVPPDELRDAYNALWLALLDLLGDENG